MRAMLIGAMLAAISLAGSAGSAAAAEVQDAESASHGSDAAAYQLLGTYEYPGFKIHQIELPVLSHFSYLLASDGKALVVDPGRDIGFYRETAKQNGLELVGVFLTHSHADFVAGHAELAAQGLPVYISQKAGAEYDHKPLADGDTLEVGQAVVRFLATPGHTPDGMCAVVSSKARPDAPLAMFTGDTLFIGSVGRPDLLGKGMSAASLASMLFDTLTNKLLKLPDEVMIFPAHGAGSLCGAHLSDEPTSTLGEQRRTNSYLQHTTRGAFIAAVLEGLPEAPQYFAHNAAMNRQGPPLVDWAAKPQPMDPSDDLTDPKRYYVVDLRDAKEYAAAHVPNSVAIGLRGRFETWTGTMVPWNASVVLVGSDAEVEEAAHRLHRVGYNRADNPARALSLADWRQAGLETKATEMIAPRDLSQQMSSAESSVIVDVRQPAEWSEMRIGTVVNLPLGHLSELAMKLDPAERLVTVCNSAYRSIMAAGVLEREGFDRVANLAGGSEAWIEAGLPVIESQAAACPLPAAGSASRLPDRLAASELNRMLMDLPPGSFTIVDIRPAEQFADYSLPAAQNVPLDALLTDPAWLEGTTPLVIVDRDGSLAMMAAGILAQKTDRPIKALYGGLAEHWRQSYLPGTIEEPTVTTHAGGGGATPAVSTATKAGSGGPSAKSTAPPSGKTQPPAPPKKRSAGC